MKTSRRKFLKLTTASTLPIVLSPIKIISENSQSINSESNSIKLQNLFNEDFEWRKKNYPEGASSFGDKSYNSKLTDISVDAIKGRNSHSKLMLDKIKSLNKSNLSEQEKISYDLFLQNKLSAIEGAKFNSEYLIIDQLDGPQLGFARLIQNMPYTDLTDYENYFARMKSFPVYVDQIIQLLKLGIETKWVQPQVPLKSVPSQIENQFVKDLEESVYYNPCKKFPKDFSESDKLKISNESKKIISEKVYPAFSKLLEFIKNTYLPNCRKNLSVLSIPNGEEYYNYSIQNRTTTKKSSREIHEIGLSEVSRIRNLMEKVIAQVKFNGSFNEFLNFLRTDQQFYYTNAEELISGYRNIAKRVDGELPKLFAELPRLSYGVRAFADYEAPAQTTARYFPGAADGTRAGFFMANTYKLETRPKYEMEALTIHEAMPGHHLQIARGQELRNLPEFRRQGGYTAFVEGWALYSESLGEEMGFYTDPYSKFGQLTYEMWRACRLVIDTGIHAYGWSREQSIDHMKFNSAKSENDIAVEIDRYIVWPAQALAYKIGELKIKELKEKAKIKLGSKFDIRKFHNAVLDNGALPLDILENQIDKWIIEQNKS
ncbi:MAG: DUF885 domain-containing protein [Bacteroidetes bacterium]|nr:DUF885 domain-containing protein [Bacteroidota bacterium]